MSAAQLPLSESLPISLSLVWSYIAGRLSAYGYSCESSNHGRLYGAEIHDLPCAVDEQDIGSSIRHGGWKELLVQPVCLADAALQQIPFHGTSEAFLRHRDHYSIVWQGVACIETISQPLGIAVTSIREKRGETALRGQPLLLFQCVTDFIDHQPFL